VKKAVGEVARGPSREWVCRACGALRRASAWRRPRATAVTVAPRCHDAEMTGLSYEQGEAASRLAAGARVELIATGAHVVRRAGRRTWRAATNAREIAEAREQVATFEMARRPSAPPDVA